MRVVCFGDSNTHGYDPRSCLDGRYDGDSRWVDILAAQTGWTVDNWGENGREIPQTPPVFPKDTGFLILMLGTNDLLQGRSPQQAAEKLEGFLTGLPFAKEQVLLIAPPPLALGEWVRDRRMLEDSREFCRLCGELAARRGIAFADAGKWGISLAYDGVHFTAQGHRAFAAGLLEVIR